MNYRVSALDHFNASLLWWTAGVDAALRSRGSDHIFLAAIEIHDVLDEVGLARSSPSTVAQMEGTGTQKDTDDDLKLESEDEDGAESA